LYRRQLVPLMRVAAAAVACAVMMDAATFRERGKQMVDYIADYLETIERRRVLPVVSIVLVGPVPVVATSWCVLVGPVPVVATPRRR